MQAMLGSKFFWIALALVVPFVVIWIAASLLHAIVAYAVFGGLLLLYAIQMGQRPARRGRGDVHIYLPDFLGSTVQTLRRPKRKSPIARFHETGMSKSRKRGL